MMKSVRSTASLPVLARPTCLPSRCQSYATQTGLGTTRAADDSSRRRRVTVLNDDGRVNWGSLSTGEKIARTTQQSFNFTLIAGGAAATIAVAVLLFTDVFSPDSSVSHYNRAVDRVREDARAIELLGPSNQISAIGEGTGTSWRRSRPRAHIETDKIGTERLRMHFPVEGPKGRGMVDLYMLRRSDETHYHYGHLNLEVQGQKIIHLETSADKRGTDGTTFLGIKWR